MYRPRRMFSLCACCVLLLAPVGSTAQAAGDLRSPFADLLAQHERGKQIRKPGAGQQQPRGETRHSSSTSGHGGSRRPEGVFTPSEAAARLRAEWATRDARVGLAHVQSAVDAALKGWDPDAARGSWVYYNEGRFRDLEAAVVRLVFGEGQSEPQPLLSKLGIAKSLGVPYGHVIAATQSAAQRGELVPVPGSKPPRELYLASDVLQQQKLRPAFERLAQQLERGQEAQARFGRALPPPAEPESGKRTSATGPRRRSR